MTSKQLNFQLIIDGTDLTDYVVNCSREHNLCDPIASLNLVLAPDLPINIEPYQDTVLYEDNTKVFTGYTQDSAKARMPNSFNVLCRDVLTRAQDTWMSSETVANGEPVTAWIRHFLNKAGLKKVITQVREEYAVYPGYGWGISTAWDAILSCLQMSPYQIYAGADGIIYIIQRNRNATPSHTIVDYIDYERTRNDFWIRNRAVVYGNGFVTDISESNPYILPGESRAAIVATGQIYYDGTAAAIANKMLEEFREPFDVKVILLEGSPDYKLGQVVSFTDPFTGYNKDDCIITGISTELNSVSGYTTEITLDEKCISFWGWDQEPPDPPPHIYVGMSDSGVYKTEWDFISPDTWGSYNTGLSGSALTVYDIKISDRNGVMWLATAGGLYKRLTNDDTWLNVPLPLTDSGLSVTPISIYLSKVGYGIICLLVIDSNNTPWVYRTINNCDSWNMINIGGGDTFTFDTDAEGWAWHSNFADMSGEYDPIHGHDAPGCLKASTSFPNSSGWWAKVDPGWVVCAGDSIRAWLYLDGITQVRFVFWYTDLTASFSTWKTSSGWSQKTYSLPVGDVGKTVSTIEIQFGNTPYGGPPIEYGYADDVEFLYNTFTPYVAGRTHLIDSDDEYIYVSGDTGTAPAIYRIPVTLSEYTKILSPESGTWAGVLCDYSRIWAFGDFGATSKVQYSDDYGETWVDVTDATWGANEVVRSIITANFVDYIAILSVDQEAWRSNDDGETWSKVSDLALPANFGRGLYSGSVFIGDAGADANILQFSRMSGIDWAECSTGLPAGKRMANVIEEINYVF